MKTLEKKSSNKNLALSLTFTAMFGALAAVLMLYEFPIFFTLPFIKLGFSDIPVVLGAYTLGPIGGCAIAFIKIALNFIMDGSTTVGVGELANLLFCLSYILPAVFIYRLKRTKKAAILSLVCATLIAAFCAVLLDWFVVFPFYLSVSSDLTMEALISMGKASNPLVSNGFSLMMLSVFPANLLKFGLESAIAYFAYVPLRKLINSLSGKLQKAK